MELTYITGLQFGLGLATAGYVLVWIIAITNMIVDN